MINADPVPGPEPTESDVHAVAHSGARGALALAGIATLIVVGLWFAFYLLVFVPRALVP